MLPVTTARVETGLVPSPAAENSGFVSGHRFSDAVNFELRERLQAPRPCVASPSRSRKMGGAFDLFHHIPTVMAGCPTHSRFLRMCGYPRQLFSVPFSSHPTGERYHRHRTQTRATMKSDGSSPKCAVKPRWPSSLLQNPFSALFENRNGNKLALPRPKSLFRNTLTISHLQ